MEASQNADHTSRSPTVVEFGQPADVAAQPNLGLLPERGPGAGSGNPARIIASWKNLKLAIYDEGQHQKEKYWPRRVWLRKYCSVPCMGLQFQWEQAIRVCSQGLEALVQSKGSRRLICSSFCLRFCW